MIFIWEYFEGDAQIMIDELIRINYIQVIAAEGEQKASHALKEAAMVIQESSSALQVFLLNSDNPFIKYYFRKFESKGFILMTIILRYSKMYFELGDNNNMHNLIISIHII